MVRTETVPDVAVVDRVFRQVVRPLGPPSDAASTADHLRHTVRWAAARTDRAGDDR
jgi:hypothetical protein